eukprot:ANDGO_00382.mRNA.1 hypothetical protein
MSIRRYACSVYNIGEGVRGKMYSRFFPQPQQTAQKTVPFDTAKKKMTDGYVFLAPFLFSSNSKKYAGAPKSNYMAVDFCQGPKSCPSLKTVRSGRDIHDYCYWLVEWSSNPLRNNGETDDSETVRWLKSSLYASSATPSMKMQNDEQSKACGILLSVACADILEAPVDGWNQRSIEKAYGSLYCTFRNLETFQQSDAYPPYAKKTWKFAKYTDRTEQMLAVAFSIAERQRLEMNSVAKKYAEFYSPPRGYSKYMAALLLKLAKTADIVSADTNKEHDLPFAISAVLRCAPLAFVYRNAPPRVLFEVVRAALAPICGANNQILEAAVLYVVVLKDLILNKKIDLHNYEKSNDSAIGRAVQNAVRKFEEFNYSSPELCICDSVRELSTTPGSPTLVAAMCGAAFGTDWIPTCWWSLLENGSRGRDEILVVGKILGSLNLTVFSTKG